jgi:hypothetical protein
MEVRSLIKEETKHKQENTKQRSNKDHKEFFIFFAVKPFCFFVPWLLCCWISLNRQGRRARKE